MADYVMGSPTGGPEPTLASHFATKNYADTTRASIAINTQTASYTLALNDAGVMVELNSSSAATVTVPPNSSVAVPVGARVWIRRMGTGTVTVAAGAGVTLRAPTGLSIAAQYGRLEAHKRASDEWVIS